MAKLGDMKITGKSVFEMLLTVSGEPPKLSKPKCMDPCVCDLERKELGEAGMHPRAPGDVLPECCEPLNLLSPCSRLLLCCVCFWAKASNSGLSGVLRHCL